MVTAYCFCVIGIASLLIAAFGGQRLSYLVYGDAPVFDVAQPFYPSLVFSLASPALLTIGLALLYIARVRRRDGCGEDSEL